MSDICPKCGNSGDYIETATLSNPSPDAYNIIVCGKTYRQLGMAGKGKWKIYSCDRGHDFYVWAVMVELY